MLSSTESTMNYTRDITILDQTVFDSDQYRASSEAVGKMLNLTVDANQTTIIERSEIPSASSEEMINSTMQSLNTTSAMATVGWTTLEQKGTPSGHVQYEIPFLTTVCVVGFIGNLLVVAVYSQKKARRHNSSLYILNLAIGDLLALVVAAFHVTEFYRSTWPFVWKTDPSCIIHRYFRYVGFNITVSTMVAIAIDRYFAICHPMKFKTSFTLRRTKVILVFLWILSLAAAIPSMFMFKAIYHTGNLGDTYTGKLAFACKLDMPDGDWFPHFKVLYFNLVLFYIPSLATFILNIKIVIEVWKSNKGIGGETDCRKTDSKFDRTHWKVGRTLMIVFMAYFMSYVLFMTHNLQMTYLRGNAIRPIARNVGLLLPYGNSCMNPIIYSFFNPKFRKECCNLVLCRGKVHRTPSTNACIIRKGSSSENVSMTDVSISNPMKICDE
ncbi:somatostatin receptor type 2-like [Ptychodera flava]|uniref:somatostatin receptor type 2-like n=1 Tax=Ptychodera flava TaxID=63121 RepID=UPI00396A6784